MSMSSPSSEPEPQPRRTRRLLPVADVLAAIKAHRGNITRIAEQFDVPRSVIYLKIRSKPTLVQAQNDEREARKDRIEKGLDDAIDRGERWAIALGITLLCADRGYKLPKNGVFGDGETKISEVNVTSIAINAYEEGQFAPPGAEAVRITALAPPPEPDDPDDSLLIEGEFTEAQGDGE
jgi:hypothetical protein